MGGMRICQRSDYAAQPILFAGCVHRPNRMVFAHFNKNDLFGLTAGMKFCLFGVPRKLCGAEPQHTGWQAIQAANCPTVSDKRLRAV